MNKKYLFKGRKIVLWTMFGLLMLIFLPRILFLLLGLPSSGLIPGVACVIMGGRWMDAGSVAGCYKKYRDGNKSCTSSSECSANFCYVNGYYQGNEVRPMNNLIGKCPATFFIGGEKSHEVDCGQARIENGMVVEDKRDCLLIY